MKARLLLPMAVLVATVLLVVSCGTSDTFVTAKIKTKLATDDAVKSQQIEVQTQNGVVTLTGNVDSQEAKDRALELAKFTNGVAHVTDMVAVRTASGTGDAPEPNRTIGERIDDAGITMNVKTRLLDDPVVKGLAIDVDTRNGVVFLTGSVRSEAEKDKAIQLVKDTSGVREVQANLRIGSSS